MCGFTCSAPGTPLDWLSETAGLGFLPTRGQGRVIDRSGRPTPPLLLPPAGPLPCSFFPGAQDQPWGSSPSSVCGLESAISREGAGVRASFLIFFGFVGLKQGVGKAGPGHMVQGGPYSHQLPSENPLPYCQDASLSASSPRSLRGLEDLQGGPERRARQALTS